MSKTKIVEQMDALSNRIIQINIIESDIKYLADAKAEYFQNIVSKSNFLHRCYIAFMKSFVIEVHKCLNPREHYNIISLYSLLIKNYHDIEWKHDTQLAYLKQKERDIIKLTKSDQFIRLKDTRNKYYAHDDRDKHTFNTAVSRNSYWDFSKTLKDTYNDLSLRLNGSQFFFDTDLLRGVLLKMNLYHKIEDYVFEEYKKTSNIGRLSEVLDIIRGKIN